MLFRSLWASHVQCSLAHGYHKLSAVSYGSLHTATGLSRTSGRGAVSEISARFPSYSATQR